MIVRYLAWRVSVMTCAVLGALVFLLWMGQSLRFMELLSVYRISIGQFCTLMAYMLPDLLGVVLPFAFVVSVIWIMNQMIRDRELVVLRGSGFSDLHIVKGIVMASGVWGCVVWGIQGYGAPWALKHFKVLEAECKNITPKKLLRSGEFVACDKLTVYVGQREGLICRKIFLHDTRSSKPVTIVARAGVLDPARTKTTLVLHDGLRQEWDPKTHQVTHLTFQQYNLELELPSRPSRRIPKPFELSMTELLVPSEDVQDTTHAQKMKIEGHQRILSAFYLWATVFLCLIAILSVPHTRQPKVPLLIGLGITLCFQVIYYGLIHLSLRWPAALVLVYGIALLGLIIPWMMMTDRYARVRWSGLRGARS